MKPACGEKEKALKYYKFSQKGLGKGTAAFSRIPEIVSMVEKGAVEGIHL